MPDWSSLLFKGVLAAVGIFALPPGASAGDAKALPPEFRTFHSRSGEYVLEIRGSKGWKQPLPQAELFREAPAGRVSRWTKALPHRFGPRFAFVSDKGQVMLFDEWLITPSPYAIAWLADNGDMRLQRSMAEISTAAGVSGRELVRRARCGPWMSAAPALSGNGNSILVEAGGIGLEVGFDSGLITRQKSVE